MRLEDARQLVAEAIGEVAPELELADLDPALDLRDQADLDSMDFLNLVVALCDRSGIDIPERDYLQLQSIDAAVAYLVARA